MRRLRIVLPSGISATASVVLKAVSVQLLQILFVIHTSIELVHCIIVFP